MSDNRCSQLKMDFGEIIRQRNELQKSLLTLSQNRDVEPAKFLQKSLATDLVYINVELDRAYEFFLDKEFERQTAKIISYYKFFDLGRVEKEGAEQFFYNKYFLPLKAKLLDMAGWLRRERKKADIPFLIAVRDDAVPIEQQLEEIKLDDKTIRGWTNLHSHRIKNMVDFNRNLGSIYLLSDIRIAKEIPDNASDKASLTVEEGIALVRSYPEFITSSRDALMLYGSFYDSEDLLLTRDSLDRIFLTTYEHRGGVGSEERLVPYCQGRIPKVLIK